MISTNKKLLLSLATVAGAVFLVCIGVWIHNSLINGVEQTARMYRTALQTTSDKELNYSIDTHQNYVLSPVTIKSVDKVKFPEMNKEFSGVKKEEERYTKHEREECTYDDEGKVEECHTEYYYTWDTTNRWSAEAKKVTMADREYSMSLFNLRYNSIDAKDIIDGQNGRYVYERVSGGIFGRSWFSSDTEGDKRYSYDVLSLPKSGTVFLNLSDSVSAGSGSEIALDDRSPEQIVTDALSASQTQSTIFKVLWTILVLLELGVCGYFVWLYKY